MQHLALSKAMTGPLTAVFSFIQSVNPAAWTFPAVLGSAIVIAWAAEAAQFLVSQGLALAILAWLQTLPEFAVEAVIAWEAGQTMAGHPGTLQAHNAMALMTANFTGSLRLLVGLGWPMIYATAATSYRQRNNRRLEEITLEREHAVEVVFLLIAIGYFCIVWLKGTLTWVDTVLLALIYFIYLYFLNRVPPQEEEKMEEMGYVPRFILGQSRAARNVMIIGLFTGGGLILYFTVHPFLESLKTLALGLGVSAFVFVQWFAPFLSEFPEKVSAFKWARRVTTAPMALMNMVSSNINQWTMLVAMLPVAFATGLGHWETIAFDQHQKAEILLTISQSLAGAMLFARMRFARWEAVMLFLLWMLQFILSGFEKPIDQTMAHNALAEHLAAWLAMTVDQLESIARGGKEIITVLYFAWTAIIISVAMKRRSLFEAIAVFPRLLREHR